MKFAPTSRRRSTVPPLPSGTVTFLFTDIEGSTRLWETQREAMTPALARHDALLRQCIEAHGGNVVKTLGDGVHAVFVTASNALRAALAAQQALRAEAWSKHAQIRVRMALHTGTAELREGDYYGPTLNRAARLMAIGHGGQTLLSAATYDLCSDQLPPGVSLKPLGEYSLKDLARPETVFQLCHLDLPQAFPPLKTLLAPMDADTPSIAVLPFVNMSREEENEYFADGLAEELLNVLSRIRGLRVASRTSAFSFKGTKVDIPTVAQKLNVATVLEGSVRKAGKRVRITAQLVEVATALLGEKPDAPASAAVKAELQAAAKGRGANAKAYALYLQGRFVADRITRDDLAKGIGYFREALELDPGYALAWAELSRAHLNEAGYSWAPLESGFGKARMAAERALELEPDLAEAYVALGLVQMNYDWDWQRADASFRRALSLAPGNAEVLRGAAVLAGTLGRNDEAVALARRAVALDPLSMSAHRSLGARCLGAGLLDEAEAVVKKAIEFSPQGGLLHAWLGRVHLAQGRIEEAREAFEKEVIEYYYLQGLAVVAYAQGRQAESDNALRQLIDKHAQESAYQVAEVYAYRGETDLAFAWLERAYAQRDPGLSSIRSNALLRNLHGDPRWRAFLEKMRLAE
ncbi:MAG: tetratricopeptide repeat protein [Betaproteobacteria bacterium]|nr:MAG: tetratricopeptide repeat protein [Betaproteobacteria bacterium]